MIVVKYTNPKVYGQPQWFVTSLNRSYKGSSYRHFIYNRMDNFILVDWYDMPTLSQLKSHISIEPMPDSLKSHILNVIFTYSKESSGFQTILNLLSVKG